MTQAESERLWPHPSLQEKFEKLLKQDNAVRAKLREIEKGFNELKLLQAEFSQNAADTVHLSIMQRDNAEAQIPKDKP